MTARRNPTLADLLESFFRQRLAAQRRASPATVASYRDALRLLLVFAAEQTGKDPSRLDIEDLSHELILAWLDHLECERGNCPRTRNARRAAVRSFFRHVAYADPALMGLAQRILAIPGKRTIRRTPNYLPHEEFHALLAAVDRSAPRGRRDYALLLFLAKTGARVSEATRLDRVDLRLETPAQVLLHGKGPKERVVPLGEDTVAALRTLCNERGIGPDAKAAVFVNARGQRLSRYGARHILRRVVAVAAKTLPEITKRSPSPHTLRHTSAMHLLQAGVDLTVIQAWLGHATLNTAHQYVEADIEMKRRALEKSGVIQAEPVRYKPPDPLLALLERL